MQKGTKDTRSYEDSIKDSSEKNRWRAQRVEDVRQYHNGKIPKGTFLVTMAGKYTIYDEKGKQVLVKGKPVLDPDSLIARLLQIGYVTRKQIITIDRTDWVQEDNDKLKMGVDNRTGDFFDVMQDLICEKKVLSYIDEDMMCLPVNSFSDSQARLFSQLSTQPDFCILALNVAMKARNVKSGKNGVWEENAYTHLRGIGHKRYSFEECKAFRQSMRQDDEHKAGLWQHEKETVYHPTMHRYIASKMEMETGIYIKTENPNYIMEKQESIKVYKTLSPAQKAWVTRRANGNG